MVCDRFDLDPERIERDVADYDRLCTKLIKAVPLSDVSASFAMERIKYETAVPV
tara:strand:- start:2309 stop:2470 length:162 start_codon:yes stop_codon:yes gene_type:complete